MLVMLVLLNVIIKLSNLRIKNKVLLNVTKIESNAMLILLNESMELSNLRKKMKESLYVTGEL